ncbi:hypothetical protein EI94DRAFT_1325450 [Lactarius quietus]|nr:hypothetical protein EI94DRAFT_1325450 [Lactarius quietus]
MLSRKHHTDPLGVLPVELLAHIFTFASSGVPDNAFLSYPGWLPITHVCRHWRTIALSHGQLWTTVTPGLSLRWIKVFIERSQSTLMDFTFLVYPLGWQDTRNPLRQTDIILILKGFTRIRSLCLEGHYGTTSPILESLRHPLPVQSFSLRFLGRRVSGCHLPPNDLFGGNAPVRRLHFLGDDRIVAPNWLLHNVTHFTNEELITPSELINVLREMPSLSYFEIRPHYQSWMSHPENLSIKPIKVPQLMNLIVHHTSSPRAFILLNQLLLSHVDAKRRLELYISHSQYVPQIDQLSPIVADANGFSHIHFSGSQQSGSCRLWTGDAVTTYDNAKFCLSFGWHYFHRLSLDHFITECDALGAPRVRRLAIDSLKSPALPMSSWWKLLENLPGIEELELDSASVDALGAAWKVNLAPAVMPALRRVRIANSELASAQQYAIIGDSHARKIIRLPMSTEGDVAPFSELVSAEKELEDMSKGLLKLLRGLGLKKRKKKRRQG